MQSDMTREPTVKAGRFRLRMSLLTALLVMTIVGMVIVILESWRQIDAQRQEIGGLRKELGYLSINDENKIYVTQIPVNEPDTRRFRIFLPKNKTFTLYTRKFSVPGRKPDDSREAWLARLLQARRGSNQDIESGEHTIEVQIRQNPVPKDHWELSHRLLGIPSQTTATIPGLKDRRAWSISSEPLMGKQQELNPADGVVLFALREGGVKETNGRFSKIKPDETKEAPGVILWIAPAEGK